MSYVTLTVAMYFSMLTDSSRKVVSGAPSASVVVFISGCHMSHNPGPGVGVGRALRAKYSSEQKVLPCLQSYSLF